MKEMKPLERLIKAREEMGLTQEEFAKLVDLSRPMLSHYERGYSIPPLPVAYRIAKVLNASIEQIFFGKNVQKMNNRPA